MTESTKVPNVFICPISQMIMSDPVFNEQGITFDRKAIEQWIDKNGTDPYTKRPLQKKDLKPNRHLRDGIQKFVQGLSKQQKEQVQFQSVYQVTKLQQKELELKGQRASQSQKQVQKLLKQLKFIKNELLIQKQQKELAVSQCYALRKENFELIQLQKNYCLEIDKLQKMVEDCKCNKQKHNELVTLSLKVTPDTTSRSFQEENWVQDNANKNVCIVNISSPDWLCSSSLPSDGEFQFTIKVLKMTQYICIGIMESDKKNEKFENTYNHLISLDPYSQSILRANEDQTDSSGIKSSCSSQIPKLPFQIKCHVNRQQNTIAWHYGDKQQEKAMMLNAWKTQKKQLCAIVYLHHKGDSVEMM